MSFFNGEGFPRLPNDKFCLAVSSAMLLWVVSYRIEMLTIVLGDDCDVFRKLPTTVDRTCILVARIATHDSGHIESLMQKET